jgi:hypothetical protein
MKVKMKGKIRSIVRLDDETAFEVKLNGRVQETKMISAKEAKGVITFTIKTAMADNVKVGATITIDLSDEEADTDKLD